MKQPDKDQVIHNLTLDRFEEGQAVLIGKENIELILPKKMLPKDTKEGSILMLTISSDEAEAKKREKTAKELLNEILNVQK